MGESRIETLEQLRKDLLKQISALPTFVDSRGFSERM